MTDGSETVANRSLPPGLRYISDIALYVSESGELIDWNDSFSAYVGWVDDERPSIVTKEVFSDPDRNRLRAGVKQALETGSETVSVSIYESESTSREFTLTLSRVPDEWTTSRRVIAVGRNPKQSSRPTDETPTETEHVDRLERALSQVYEIVSDDDWVLDDKINSVLEYIRQTLGTDLATLSRVEDEKYIFEALDSSEEIGLEIGDSVSLEWTNCERVIASEETLVLDDIKRQAPELLEKQGNVEFNINSYLGAPVVSGENVYGTFCFYGSGSSREEFSKWEVTLVNVVSKWIGYELERGQLSDDLQRRDRERYETLVTQSSDAIMVIRDGKYDFVNERFAAITGYDRTELLGMSFEEVVAPEYHNVVRERYEGRIAGESPPDTYEIEILTATDERRMLELSATPLSESGETAVLANARDITQRKRREQATSALQDATERIQIADSTHEIAETTVDAVTKVLGISHAICWLHDEETSALEPVAMSDAIEEHERDRTYTPGRYEYEVFRDGEVTKFTPSEVLDEGSFATGYLFPLGEYGLLGIGHPNPIDTDTVLFELAESLAEHTTTALDRVLRTQELRENERRYRAIFNQTYQFTGLMMPDGTLIEANETALDFGDLDSDDVIGKKVWNADWFSHSDELQQRIRSAVERAASGEFIRKEIPIQGSDRMAMVDYSIRPITDANGEVTLLIPEARDITELKERERDLRQERDHIKRTEQLARVGGWEIDSGSDTLRVTNGVQELFGVDAAIELTPESMHEYIHPDDRDRFSEALETCRSTGEQMDLELQTSTAVSRTQWLQITGERVDEDGTSVRGALRDISNRKERQQRLTVLNRVLRHNLRNRLTVVDAYTNELESKLDTNEGALVDMTDFSVETARSHLETIQQSTEDLLSVAEKVRSFEKVIPQMEELEPVSVAQVLAPLIESYEQQHPNVEINAELDDQTVVSNEEVLRLALDELLTNAIQHNHQPNPQITINVHEQKNMRKITVVDNGPGIPKQERDVLNAGTETPLEHGSGIGLWTVQWLISRIGGQMDIEDNTSGGTVISLSLPWEQ